jgi:hypothetical protein
VGPLGFVDWRSVNRLFCGLMWMVALVLALIVLLHLHTAPDSVRHVALPTR